MSSVPLMGFQGRGYAAAAGEEPVNEIKSCRDLAYGMPYSEVDTTVQGNRGVKSYSKGLQDCVITWNQVVCEEYDEADSLVMTAIGSRTPIALHFVEKTTGVGPRGTFLLFGGSQTMSGDGVQVIPVTARPATGYPAAASAASTIED